MTIIYHRPGVNGLGGPSPGSTEKTQFPQNQTSPAQAPSGQAAGSQPGEVEITHTAQLLANVAQQIAGTPDVDQSRVDAIRQSLSDGTYRTDASRVADGVLAAQKFDAQAAAGASAGPQSNTAKAFAATAQLGTDRN